MSAAEGTHRKTFIKGPLNSFMIGLECFLDITCPLVILNYDDKAVKCTSKYKKPEHA